MNGHIQSLPPSVRYCGHAMKWNGVGRWPKEAFFFFWVGCWGAMRFLRRWWWRRRRRWRRENLRPQRNRRCGSCEELSDVRLAGCGCGCANRIKESHFMMHGIYIRTFLCHMHSYLSNRRVKEQYHHRAPPEQVEAARSSFVPVSCTITLSPRRTRNGILAVM